MAEHDPELDERSKERLKDLPREVLPPRDLWPEISAKIDAREREARRPSRLVAAAFVGAIAMAAAAALVIGRGRGGGHDRDEGASAQGDAAGASAAFTAAANASSAGSAAGAAAMLPEEADYEAAAATLRAELEARRAEEPPAVLAVVDENVRIVDDAIRAVRAALVAHPEDTELHADLDRAYQDKLDVLRAATELPSSEGDLPR